MELRQLVHVRDLEMRVRSLDERLQPGRLDALGDLIDEALAGGQAAREVCTALPIWRARLSEEQRRRLAPGAPASTAPLLAAPMARRALLPRARIEPVASTLSLHRQLLGSSDLPRERRPMRLVTHIRPLLLLGAEEAWLARLLEDPVLDERTMVMLSAHRPAPAWLSRVIASQARWMGRRAVRAALASNPFTPSPLVHALLPSLPRACWPRGEAPGVVRAGAET